jgi:hypothetical protein
MDEKIFLVEEIKDINLEIGADKYDFLCETWRWDSKNFVKPLLHKIFVQKPVGMFGEQEYHICLHVFPLYKTFIIDL